MASLQAEREAPWLAAAIVTAVIASVQLLPTSASTGSETACTELLSRYRGLRGQPSAENGGPLIKFFEELVRPKQERELERCREHLTEQAQVCANKAQSVDVFERCFP